jgi:8-amino-7-oxononanoate synthase
METTVDTTLENAITSRYGLLKNTERDILKKAFDFQSVDLLKSLRCYPYYQTIDQNEGPEAIINGEKVIMMGSNNYLGLTIHPEVRQAAMDAIQHYGTSLTGSRLLNGTHQLHIDLEKELATFLGKEAALVFTTGYQANLGVISALIGENDYLILDKFNHASITDGAALSKGKTVYYPHNDMQALEKILQDLPADAGKMIMMDGVFSMEGDLCNLPAIVALAEKYGARVTVDDAHATGVIGYAGRGTADHFGVTDKVDLIVGTFSKSLASVGGFVAGDAKVIDFIRHFGRSVLFSASLPPASVAAALKALEIMAKEPERVERLAYNASYMREKLVDLGFNIGHTVTPIVPIIVGNDMLALRLWRELLDAGIYVNSVIYPAVAKNQALLRTSYTSEHTQEHLDKALQILTAFKAKHNF